ncbi:MAG: hypothetical protein GY814_14785 [Gammaproteobacteria bacterium]|nr:hypothetical protein [Gammaproteobacteria bacterium]
MIDSISNTGMAMPPPPHGHGGASLTDDQKQLITDTLSKFDADSLTESDATSIVSSFQEAGIQPGMELAQAMEAAGFDAKAVGDMAGVQGPPPGGSQGQSGGINISEELLEELYTLLDQYYAEETTDVDRSSLMDTISKLLGSENSIFSAKA